MSIRQSGSRVVGFHGMLVLLSTAPMGCLWTAVHEFRS